MPFTLKIDIKKTENALPHSYLWFNKKKKRHCRSLQGRKQWGSLAFFVLTLQKACNILFFFFLLKVFRDVKKSIALGIRMRGVYWRKKCFFCTEVGMGATNTL